MAPGYHRIVVGADGSPHSRRAVAFVARLATRAAAVDRSRRAVAQRQLDAAVSALAKAGWRARGVVRAGLPLQELLAAIRAERADLLVLGARGAGAVKHFLLGSVADAALKRSPVGVLVVR